MSGTPAVPGLTSGATYQWTACAGVVRSEPHAVHEYPITQDLVALDFDGLYDLHRYTGTLQGWLMRIVAQRVSHADLLAELSRNEG